MLDVPQLGLLAAIGSLSYVFWVVGAMEMVERLAFYGVRSLSGLYATDPVSKGGLGIEAQTLALIFAWWAFVQSIVPAFSGGLSDRYGYKQTIFASTVLKIAGYLLMAWWATPWGFTLGATVLATGTAIFKPAIQGTLVRSTSRRNSSVAWGIFYQTINIGGFIGPVIAGRLRQDEWSYIFYANALVISLNFLLLLTYREVRMGERLARDEAQRKSGQRRESLWRESLRELIKPHVAAYLLIMSGFWFTLYGLFDVTVLHVADWVDTRPLVRTFFADGVSTSKWFNFLAVTNPAHTEIQPEGVINVNAFLIMLVCFLVAGLGARLRAITSMSLGLVCIGASWIIMTQTHAAWPVVGAIAVFSLGEMLTSPKFSEYIGNFAPHDKKAMYLGFSQIPVALGWTIEGYLGPWMYGTYSSKEQFAREALLAGVQSGQINPASQPGDWTNVATAVQAIPQGEAFDYLVRMTGREPWELTSALAAAHPSIAYVWYVMAAVALTTAVAIYIYGAWVRRTAAASA